MAKRWNETVGAIALLACAGCYSGASADSDGDSGSLSGQVSDSGGGTDTGDTPEPPPADELDAPSTAVRRLSQREVDNVIGQLFGVADAGSTYLPLDVLSPFDTDAETKLPSAVFVDGHEALAEQVATTFAADRIAVDAFSGCTPSGSNDEGCLRQLASQMGRRLWRRPMAAEELDPLVATALEFSVEQNDFYVGAQLIAQSLLLSPEFIYLTQVGTERGGVQELTSHELVSRLSFLILGTAPDEEMLALADAGPIGEDELAELAEQLLSERTDPVGEQFVAFHSMWFGIREPRVPSDVRDAASAETEALLRRVLVDDPSAWTELFTSTQTYVTADLAELYGLPVPAGGEGWVDYPDPAEQSGLLSHMSWLSQSALTLDETSPTKRGIRVVEGLLCRSVPPPPPDVDTDNVEVPDTGCLSDFYAGHSQPGTLCHGCHTAFDPVGLGLERWDAYGRWREEEPGRPMCPIDGVGHVTGMGDFSGPRQLSELMLESGELTRCLAERVVQFSTGREAEPEDDAVIDRIHQQFLDEGSDARALMLAYVTDPVFRYRIDPEVCQ